MNNQERLEVLDWQMKEIKQELETLMRIQKKLESKMTDLEKQRTQLTNTNIVSLSTSNQKSSNQAINQDMNPAKRVNCQ